MRGTTPKGQRLDTQVLTGWRGLFLEREGSQHQRGTSAPRPGGGTLGILAEAPPRGCEELCLLPIMTHPVSATGPVLGLGQGQGPKGTLCPGSSGWRSAGSGHPQSEGVVI